MNRTKKVEKGYKKLLDDLLGKGKDKDKDLNKIAKALAMEPIALQEVLAQIKKAQDTIRMGGARKAVAGAFEKNIIIPFTNEELKQSECEHFWQVYTANILGDGTEELQIICAKCLKRDAVI